MTRHMPHKQESFACADKRWRNIHVYKQKLCSKENRVKLQVNSLKKDWLRKAERFMSSKQNHVN